MRRREHRPGARHLVRRAHVAPAPDRRPQLADRGSGIALGDQDPTKRDLPAASIAGEG